MYGGYLDTQAQLNSDPRIRRSHSQFWTMSLIIGGILLVLTVISTFGLAIRSGPVAAMVFLPLALVMSIGLAALLGWVFQQRGWLQLFGDSFGVWKMRATGAPLSRVWNRHWNTPPEYHGWLYGELLAGNLDAIQQLGPGTGLNVGELYLALYAAPQDRVAFLVMSTQTGKRLGADTGWRPIELRGEWYDYAFSRFNFTV